MKTSKKQKVLLGHLEQNDCYVYATKAYAEESSRHEGSHRTVKISIIDKHPDTDEDYYPIAELETYIVNVYGNRKHWRKILQTLDDDCVVQLHSANGKINLIQRDLDIPKNKKKPPLVDADTPFQILNVYPTDNYGNNVILDDIRRLKLR